MQRSAAGRYGSLLAILACQLFAGPSGAGEAVAFTRQHIALPTSDHVAVADVNRDGHLDLIVNNWHQRTVAVLLGDGTGSFGPPTYQPSPGERITGLPVGDLNGDGILDLVFSSLQLPSSNGFIDIWYGLGALTGSGGDARWFYAPRLPGADAGPPGKVMNLGYTAVGGVALGDFNQDGKLDLAVVRPCCTGFSGGDNGVHTTVAVFLGGPEDTTHTSEHGFHIDGRLFYRAPDFYNVVVPGSPSGGGTFITTADVNGDGVLDLLTTAGGHLGNQGYFSVLPGRGDGSFGAVAHHPMPMGGAGSITVADLNGDGNADLAFSAADGIALQFGDGRGTFSSGAIALQGVPARSHVVIADVNGDGKPDLALNSGSSWSGVGAVVVSLADGAGGFGGPIIAPLAYDRLLGAGLVGLASGDFNADGKVDFVTAHEQGVTVLLNAQAPVSLSVSPASATVPVGSTQQFVALADSGTGAARELDPSSVRWSSGDAAVATVDADGRASAVSIGATQIGASCELIECSQMPAGLVSWWRGEGTGKSTLIFGPGLIYDFHFGQHGIMRTVPAFVPGRTGTAVKLNGVNESIFVSHSIHHATPAFSLATWLKLTRGGLSIPASKYGGNYRGWILYASPDFPECSFQFYVSRPSIFGGVCAARPVALNEWVHVAATYDGNSVAIYIDGALAGRQEFPGGYAPHNDWLFIGQASWFGDGFMAGLVDEFQLYNRALSASEVQLLFSGNLAATAELSVVSADTVAPSTTAAVSPLVNSAGWNNSRVTVRLSATDNPGGSGVQSITYDVNGATTTVSGADTSFPISTEGSSTVTYQATDNNGNVESPKSLTVRIDTSAPSSVAAASPGPNGAGWNNSDVTVTLTASDTSGSGVQAISYRINGGAATTVTGASASFVVSAEGENSISYSATDVAGNVEAPKTHIVRIDRTAPSATLSLSPDMLWPPNHRLVNVAPTLAVAPDASGTVTVSGPVVTSNEPADGLGDGDTAPDWVVSTGRLQLRAERAGGGSGRVYTVTYTLTDQAGNTSQVSRTVTVPHDQGR